MVPTYPRATVIPTARCTGISASVVAVGVDRIRLRQGQLRAQRNPDRDGWIRIGLLATTALLLGGDEVDLEVEVGPGARLDLYDVTGTVAYHGRGAGAAWRLRVKVAAGGALRYRGEPFIVSDGADVHRTTDLDVAAGAALWLRETLVLGRTGQLGGRLRNGTRLRVAGSDVWLEDQDLDPDGDRLRPGLLGDSRVIDSVLRVGGAPDAAGESAAVRFTLADGSSTLTRYLGTSLAASPLHLPGRHPIRPT